MLVFALLRNRRVVGLVFERDVQHAFVAAAQNRQHAVAGHGANRLTMVEIIAEFFAFGFFAFNDLRVDFGFIPQLVTQRADEFRVFGKLLHQNRARAVQRGFAVGDVFVQVALCGGFNILRLLGKQHVCQWLQPVFARDLRFGAAFGFVRQIQVFQRGFVIGGFDLRPEVV